MFALIDGNNFFVSCERVFRPDLWQRPVIVLSNNDDCVISRSAEAKALGIKMGVPLFQVAALVRQRGVVMFSSNFELYADLSRRMMQTVATLVPRIEVTSIDEVFANLHGVAEQTALGRVLRRRIYRWVGIPACVGIAPSKTLAKFANHLAKKNPHFRGVRHWAKLSETEQRHWLSGNPASEIWGIGRKLEKHLAQQGMLTALDLQRAPPALLRKRFGVTAARSRHGSPMSTSSHDKKPTQSRRACRMPLVIAKTVPDLFQLTFHQNTHYATRLTLISIKGAGHGWQTSVKNR